MKYLVLLTLVFSLNSFASGNGVERGSAMINTNGVLNNEIVKYLGKQLQKCAPYSNDSFIIKSVKEESLRVDQGIIDLYYNVDLVQKNSKGEKVNEIHVRVLDSDFDNWRNYEEKLSIEVFKDKNNLCH